MSQLFDRKSNYFAGPFFFFPTQLVLCKVTYTTPNSSNYCGTLFSRLSMSWKNERIIINKSKQQKETVPSRISYFLMDGRWWCRYVTVPHTRPTGKKTWWNFYYRHVSTCTGSSSIIFFFFLISHFEVNVKRRARIFLCGLASSAGYIYIFSSVEQVDYTLK
jgi:hypothetical protein